MEYELTCHPDSRPFAVSRARALVERHQDRFSIFYIVFAQTDRLVLPAPAIPCRSYGLWRSTCFEFFLHDVGSEYLEFNFSPSGRWGAYHFSGYREGMEPLPLDEPPAIEVRDGKSRFSLSAVVSLPCAAPPGFGVSAIIEERAGAKSYWALSHPRGKPDFHHADCFVEFSQ